MSVILKTAVIALICAAAVTLTKNCVPQYAPFVQLAAMLAVLWIIKDTAENLINYFAEFFPSEVGDSGFSQLMVKAVGIAVIGKFVSELCRDSGNSSLAFAVELTAKVIIISMSLPMIKNLVEITEGFLKG